MDTYIAKASQAQDRRGRAGLAKEPRGVDAARA